MTDNPGGFAPPSQLFAPTPPPPYSPQRVYTPPPPPPPARKMPGLAVAGIIVGVLVLIGGVVAGIAVVVQRFGDIVAESPTDSTNELVTGEESGPLAASPDECVGECFGAATLSVATPPKEELEDLGLTYDNLDSEPPASLNQAHTLEWRAWEVGNGGSASCFAANARVPVTTQLGETEDLDRKMVHYRGTVSDDWSGTTLTQRTRFFESSELAVAHMVALDEEIGGCDVFTITEWDYSTEWTTTRAPVLDTPDNVAALGWVLSSPDGERTYVFDIQRGNYVVRTIVDSWDGITEKQYRTLVAGVAERVGAM